MYEPKPAASILVYFKDGSDFRFLMGCRSEQHKFMPGVFVFPGGKVDRPDEMVNANHLDIQMLAKADLRGLTCDLSAFVTASVRELEEETGYQVVEVSQLDQALDYILKPVADMTLIARAITPPYPGRRYDTLFFLLEVEQPRLLQPRPSSAELENLGWYTLEETKRLPVAGITQRIQKQGLAAAKSGLKASFWAQV